MTRYYVSSKLKHTDMWKASGLSIVSSWLHGGYVRGRDALSAMWTRYLQEVGACDAFVMYIEPEDLPKGCLIEMGAALACSKPIVIVWAGSLTQLEDKLGTAIYHELVRVVGSMDEVPL